jgi:hypothetical protein
MQARIATSLQGARWLSQGWRLFKAAPLGWLAMVFAYTIFMTVVSVLPVIGVVAATVLVPAFSVSFMSASRAADRGGDLGLGMLVSGFRERLPSQLALGCLYVACVALLLAVTTLADDGAFARWLATGKRPTPEIVRSDAFLAAMLLGAVLYLQVMMMFWFSPVLVAWHGVPVPKALFFSFFAVLMNWRAYIAYGIVTALVTVVMPFATLLAMTALSGGKAQPTATGLLFPLLLIIMPTLFGSFYASYRDIFGAPEEPDR